jgi:hypothetical protein
VFHSECRCVPFIVVTVSGLYILSPGTLMRMLPLALFGPLLPILVRT